MTEYIDGHEVTEWRATALGVTLEIDEDISDYMKLDRLVVAACVFRASEADYKVDEDTGTCRVYRKIRLQSLLPLGGAGREQLVSFIKHGNPQGVFVLDDLGPANNGDTIANDPPVVEQPELVDAEPVVDVDSPLLSDTATVGDVVVDNTGEIVDRQDTGLEFTLEEHAPAVEPQAPYDDGFDPSEWDGVDLDGDSDFASGDTVGHVKAGPRYSDDPDAPNGGRRKTAAELEAESKEGRKASVSYDDLLDLGGNPEVAARPVGEQVGGVRDYRGGTQTDTDRLVEQI